jgi:hypothetical protein
MFLPDWWLVFAKFAFCCVCVCVCVSLSLSLPEEKPKSTNAQKHLLFCSQLHTECEFWRVVFCLASNYSSYSIEKAHVLNRTQYLIYMLHGIHICIELFQQDI